MLCGKVTVAVEILRKILTEISPKDFEAELALATVVGMMGDVAEALKMWKELYEKAPQDKCVELKRVTLLY